MSREEKSLLFLTTPMLALAITFFVLAIAVDRNKINGLELIILWIECLLFGLLSQFTIKYDGSRWPLHLTYVFGLSLAAILVITFGITAALIGSLIFWIALKIKKRQKQKSKPKTKESNLVFKPGPDWPIDMRTIKN